MEETTNAGSMGNTNPETPKYGKLVAFILRALKLGDDAKVSEFFDGQVKLLNRDIKTAMQNIAYHQTTIVNLNEDYAAKIEDAEEGIRSAYTNIDLAKLQTNGSRAEYAPVYWKQVAEAEQVLENLKSELERKLKYEEDEIEKFNKQIDIRKGRISKIQDFN